MVPLTTLAALSAVALLAAAPQPSGAPEDRTVVVDERVTVVVPAGYTHDLLKLGDKGRLLTVTDGLGVLLVTVYNGDSPPSRAASLDVHTRELRRRVAGNAAKKLRARFLGANRPAREVRYEIGRAGHTARVAAARKLRKTVVAVWSWPDARSEVRDRLAALVEGVAIH